MLTLIIANFLTQGFPYIAPDTMSVIVTICVFCDMQLIGRAIFH